MKKLFALMLLLGCGSVQAVGVSGQGTWETTLQARDVDNDGTVDAYYDTVQDTTWLADANYSQTSGYDADGMMSWDDGQTWIDTLNSEEHLGVSIWRMPEVLDTAGACFATPGEESDCGRNIDSTTGEMAYMYFDILGNIGYDDPGWGLTNTGPFLNLPPRTYWYGTEYDLDTNFAWLLNFNGGFQGLGNAVDGDKSYERAVWAVMDGDIALVPIPAAVWLFGSGLGLLGWMRRRGS